MGTDPLQVIREEVRALSGYHVADSAGLVKLDAMENPYGLPDDLKQKIAKLIGAAAINRYPDSQARDLRRALRKALAVPQCAELILGNGSDELIQVIAMAVAKPGAVLLAPEPGFVMYRIVANLCGMRYAGVPLAPDFSLDAPAMLAAIARHKPAAVFLAYPNNPTGNLFDAEVMTDILRMSSGLVVVDEAYHAFAGKSFMNRLGNFENLLVMRTLSKLGLAGLRLGIVAGKPELVAELDKVRLPYNVGMLTQLVAMEVLRHGKVLDAQAGAIRAERKRLSAALSKLPGVKTFPSAANFILFRLGGNGAAGRVSGEHAAGRVYAGIKSRGVLVKNLDGSHPHLANCLRVSVGTPPQNDLFLAALRASL